MAGDHAHENGERGGSTRREFVATAAATAAAAAVIKALPAEAAGPASPPIYRIHPALGIARHGNADPSNFFIGPEYPGLPPQYDGTNGTRVPPYKTDQATLVKPQAARFRIFEYRWVSGLLTPFGEVNLDTPGVAAITWTVHVANKKASFYEENGPKGESQPAGPLRNAPVADRASLNSDFGARTIAGRSQPAVDFRAGTSANPASESVVIGADGTPVIDYLGQLRTDESGRLIFVGGNGKSGSNLSPLAPMNHWSNNDGWFDSSSDGPVTAVVTLTDGTTVPMDAAGNAWVFCGPPDFAPRIGSAISIYDVLTDMAVRSLAIPANALYADGGPLERLRRMHDDFQNTGDTEFPTFQPDYTGEIQPLLQIGYRYRWVTAGVNFKHASLIDPVLADPSSAAAKDRKGVFVYMNPPAGATDWGGPRTMPLMYGDDWYHGSQNAVFSFGNLNSPPGSGTGSSTFQVPQRLQQWARYCTLTRTQYGLLKNWAAGNFVPPSSGGAPPPAQITPHGLDRAALENCVGAAFFPGIEIPWQIRNPALFIEPFRLNPNATSQFILPDGSLEGGPLLPGHFSRQMAVPWQADFMDCSTFLNLAWWPSQRPDDVFLSPTDPLSARVPWARFDDSKKGYANSEAGHLLMRKHWHDFGFVIEQWGGAFVETERAAFVDSVLP
jgi:hypothetical protein